MVLIKTYVQEIYAENAANFKLFGANSVGRNESSPFTSDAPEVRKALFIQTGTLKFTGAINIPTLSEGNDVSGNGDYAVGVNSRFWVAGENVVIYTTASDNSTSGNTQVDDGSGASVTTGSSNQAMSVFGEYKITAGTFGTRNSAGFIFWAAANAQLKIEGGTTNVSQLRGAGSSGVCSYSQSGGTMIVRGNETEAGEVSGDPLFQIEDATGIFNMSGGEIILRDIGGSNTNGMFVPCPEGNYNVTGGTVTIDIRSGNDFEMGMIAPVWDLEISRLSGTGTSIVRLTNDLTVLNNLTINANCRLDVQDDLDATDYDLYIGNDFDLKDGGEYNARSNTTHFITNTSSTVYVRNTSNPGELQFNNVTIDKDQRYNTSLFHNVNIWSSGTRAITDHPIEILGDLYIQRGEFDVNRWQVDLKGNLEIVDGQIIATPSSGNPDGWIVLNGTSQQTLKGSLITEQEFGGFELDNSLGALLLSDINVNDFTLTQGIMDLDIYNLQISGTIGGSAFDGTKMFQTNGSASDGGLSLYINADGAYTYPLGTDANATVKVYTGDCYNFRVFRRWIFTN